MAVGGQARSNLPLLRGTIWVLKGGRGGWVTSHIHNWQSQQDENELWAWLVFGVIKMKFANRLNSKAEV